MAVNFDLLVTGLNIQEVLVDKLKLTTVSQSASAAQVFFYKTDKITLKNVYISTEDPLNPFTLAPNPLTLNVAGAAEQKLYYYFFNEDVDDPTQDDEELYYIQVVNSNGETIYEENNFVRNPPVSGGGDTITSLVNLAPDYGLDVLFRPSYYGSNTEIYLTDTANHPALGYIWYINDPTVGDFSYEFVSPPIGDLPGDPLHYIILTEENFGSDQTNLWYGFAICQYQELIGSTITFQFLAQDQSIQEVTSLNIGIIRSPGSLPETGLIDWDNAGSPINVGNVTLDTSFSLKTVTFTMPDIVTVPDESSATYMVIELPLDQNFKIALTGFYVYQGENEDITVTRDNLGNRYSRVFSQLMTNFILSNEDYRSANLPLMRRNAAGSINYQNRTGAFFQAAQVYSANNENVDTFNFAVPANGLNVVENYTYAEAGRTDITTATVAEKEILCNRYIENIAPNLGVVGDNSFLIFSETATGFIAQTVLVHTPYSTWVSNSGVLTITPIGQPSNHIVTAAVNGGNPNRVDITFIQNYLALTWGYRANPNEPPGSDLNVYITPPSQNVLVSWIGNIINNPGGAQATFNALGGLTVGTVNNGGVAAAEGFITFPAGGVTPAQIKSQLHTTQTDNVRSTQYINCLQFLNPSLAGSTTLPATPPYAIQFHVDDEGATVAVTDTLLTVNFPSSVLSSGSDMALFMTDALNDGTSYQFTFSGIPSNGENFLFSSTYKNFIGIFWVTNQVQPSNPIPSRPAMYIEIAPGSTIQDVVTATSTAFRKKISSTPTAANLNITIGTDLHLFMEA